MKFLFIPFSAQGHITPMLPMARELLARGDDVTFFVTAEYEALVRGAGAAVRVIDDALGMPKLPAHKTGPEAAAELGPRMFQTFVQGVRRAPALAEQVRAEAADCVLYEPMCTWARVVTRLLRLPAATLFSTYVVNDTTPSGREMTTGGKRPPLKALLPVLRLRLSCEWLYWRHGLPLRTLSQLFSAVEPLNIVCVPRRFHPDLEYFDERYLFVGPTLLPREEPSDFPFEQLEGRRTLYISLGTTPMNVRPDFYRACFQTFGGGPWQVVLVTGKGVSLEELGDIPSNFIVRPSVPQLEVLKRARVFITHGGMNSTMEGLWNGVPLVVFPQVPEQALTARQVARHGFGIAFEAGPVPSVQALRQAVETVDTEASYRTRIASFQAALQEGGGPVRAAEALRHLASSSREHVPQPLASSGAVRVVD
jgi:MGT family glycosyltransferase